MPRRQRERRAPKVSALRHLNPLQTAGSCRCRRLARQRTPAAWSTRGRSTQSDSPSPSSSAARTSGHVGSRTVGTDPPPLAGLLAMLPALSPDRSLLLSDADSHHRARAGAVRAGCHHSQDLRSSSSSSLRSSRASAPGRPGDGGSPGRPTRARCHGIPWSRSDLRSRPAWSDELFATVYTVLVSFAPPDGVRLRAALCGGDVLVHDLAARRAATHRRARAAVIEVGAHASTRHRHLFSPICGKRRLDLRLSR